jgi:flavin-dependent dehydrogenase
VRRTAALIVGGGPAGAATAIALAQGGAMPVLIERCPDERDLVCGGFLGWDAIAALRKLGLDPASLGARPIHRLRLVSGRKVVETGLPLPAAGLEDLLQRVGVALLRLRARLAERAGKIEPELDALRILPREGHRALVDRHDPARRVARNAARTGARSVGGLLNRRCSPRRRAHHGSGT